jgi:HNH endonuclease
MFQALRRDGYQCRVTGYFDVHIESDNKDFVLGDQDYSSTTEAAHIIPFAYNQFGNGNQVQVSSNHWA